MVRRYSVACLVRRAKGLRAISAALILLLLVATTAEAGVFGTATLIKDPGNGIPFSASEAALGAPWASYKLSLTAFGNDQIQAVKASFSGPLHQRWGSSNFDGIYDAPTGNSTNMANGDSHFLATGNMLFGDGPNENNPATGSPLSPNNNDSTGWGVGTSMSAVFGPAGSSLTQMDLAYLVIPKGQEHLVQFRIDVYDPTGEQIAELHSCNYFFACVETTYVSVSGNGVPIIDGDSTPRLLDNSDFGVVAAGSIQQRTYSIDVSGFGELSLQPPILTGPYSIVGAFPTYIDHGSVNFTIGLNTNAGLGDHLGSISFANDSSNASTYNFALHALVVPEPTSIGLFSAAVMGLACALRRRSAT